VVARSDLGLPVTTLRLEMGIIDEKHQDLEGMPVRDLEHSVIRPAPLGIDRSID
jgi:hypothetical protein